MFSPLYKRYYYPYVLSPTGALAWWGKVITKRIEVPVPRGYRLISSTWVECEAGTISTGGVDVRQCSKCPVNQYQDMKGQYMCKNCRAGQYAPEGSTQCTQCTPGSSENPICEKPEVTDRHIGFMNSLLTPSQVQMVALLTPLWMFAGRWTRKMRFTERTVGQPPLLG
eukprot:sb/3472360/